MAATTAESECRRCTAPQRRGTTPARDKQQLVEELRKAVETVTVVCASHGVAVEAMDALAPASLDRLSAIADAEARLVSPDATRKGFLAAERWLSAVFKAVKRSRRYRVLGARG